jgi:hypothetical protein
MQLLIYPSIDLHGTVGVLAADTWRRGMSYAREGRMLQTPTREMRKAGSAIL